MQGLRKPKLADCHFQIAILVNDCLGNLRTGYMRATAGVTCAQSLTKGAHASCDIDIFPNEIIGELWGNEQREKT